MKQPSYEEVSFSNLQENSQRDSNKDEKKGGPQEISEEEKVTFDEENSGGDFSFRQEY